jgi:hypothetical protein
MINRTQQDSSIVSEAHHSNIVSQEADSSLLGDRSVSPKAVYFSQNNSIDRNQNLKRFSSQNKHRVKYTRFPERYIDNNSSIGGGGEADEGASPDQQAQRYMYSEDMKQKIFFAKTAKNFYNLAKGYWRPTKKGKKVKIESSIQKSINIMQAYGEYDSFKDY